MLLRSQSVQQKILLVLVPVCVVPACFFIALIASGSRTNFEENMGREYAHIAVGVASQFDLYLENYFQRCAQAEADVTPEELDADAIAVLSGDGAIEWRLAEGPRRAQIGVARAEIEDWLPQAAAISLWREGRLLQERFIPIPGELAPMPLLAFARGSGDTGAVRFVLVDGERFAGHFLETTVLPASLVIFCRDDGVIVRSADKPGTLNRERFQRAMERQAAAAGWGRLDLNSGSRLFGYAPSFIMSSRSQYDPAEASWRICVQYDMDPYIVSQNKRVWLALMLGLVLVLALIAAAALMAHRIVSPLALLRCQADALARGKLDAAVEITTRDEIGELAETFNTMAERLRLSHQALEVRSEMNRVYADHINAMNEIASAIVQALSPEAIFEIIDTQLQKSIDFDAIWIALDDRQGEAMRVSHIMPAGMIVCFEDGRIPFARSLHGRVVESGEALCAEIAAAQGSPFFEAVLTGGDGLQSFLIAPLPGRGRTLGAMTVASRQPDSYGESDVTILTSLARAVAIALEQTDLFKRISIMTSELERKVETRTEELRRANDKLIQTEKYFATGRMAGNLAHEINNPLGIIKNYLQLVIVGMQEVGGGRRRSDPAMEHLAVIDEEVNRIASLVRQLLNLHRPVESSVIPIDVNGLIKSVLGLMEKDFERHDIELVRELAEDAPQPSASPDLIRQVLINLVRNAQDAIERHGRIVVRTRAGLVEVQGQTVPAVVIEISDTGCGIRPENFSQIFDPFFTTKAQDKGTGLGLCVSYSIVQMYYGVIDVDSQPGQGTTFTLTLPVLDREATPASGETGA